MATAQLVVRERMDNEEVSVMMEESKEQKRPRQFMASIELVEQ